MAQPRERPSLAPWLVSASVVLGVVTLMVLARREALASDRFQVDPAAVRVVRRPDWFPPELADALAGHLSGELSRPASLVDRSELVAWEERLPVLAHWIEEVIGIEPRYPGRARVELRLRRPELVLPGEVLVSGDGATLGVGWVEDDLPPLLFERLGGQGAAEEVAACARASADLRPYRPLLLEAGLLVDRVGVSSRGTVVFLTTEGVELEWGRATTDTEFASLDLPPSSRVDNLMDVVTRHPGLFGIGRVVLWKDRPDVLRLP